MQNHCLPDNVRPREHLSQSEIELPLRNTCYYSPLAEVGVSTQTEMKERPTGRSFLSQKNLASPPDIGKSPYLLLLQN